MEMIRYGHRIGDCRILGPGVRAVIWVHGCCFDCKGCIARAYRTGAYTEESSEAMARWYLEQKNVEGITLSGGEPMLQAAALADMIERIRRVKAMNVIVYSGFLREELEKMGGSDQGIGRLLRQIDILIDGQYVQELDDGAPYIGSSNQRIHVMNEAMKPAAEEYYSAAGGRKIELRLGREAVYLIGVPSEDQRAMWERIKKLGG